MNSLLQRIPYEEYASPNAQEMVKADIKQYVNDELEKLNFEKLNPAIGKRRVTDVFLPTFVRQLTR